MISASSISCDDEIIKPLPFTLLYVRTDGLALIRHLRFDKDFFQSIIYIFLKRPFCYECRVCLLRMKRLLGILEPSAMEGPPIFVRETCLRHALSFSFSFERGSDIFHYFHVS